MQLGPYRLLSRLGKGGMGHVWIAEDVNLLRRVAVKILPEEMASDPEWKTRFLHEARTAARLNHPGIATIYTVAEEHGTMYIAMELIDGTPLASAIAAHSLAEADAVAIISNVARALSAAHDAGVLHRDIKPENIMLSLRGPKVVDFGIAKDLSNRTQASPSLTGTNMVLGTPQYMSPEQATARPLDARSDIFSLGVVLYEAVSGRQPFMRGSLAETLIAVVQAPHPPLTEAHPALAAIVDRCLEKDRDRRFASLKDLADALDALRSHERARTSGNDTTVAITPPATAATRRALVIDDDELCRLLVRRCAERSGYAVDEAVNGADGARRLRSDVAYDVVFLDILMPRADGWSVLDHLRSASARRPERLVVITSIRDLKLSDADRLLVNDCLVKPLTADQLMPILQSAAANDR